MINEEALEAALLAKMVSSDLTKIDNLATERSSVPASRINMNQFLGELKTPRNSPLAVQQAQPQQPIHYQPQQPIHYQPQQPSLIPTPTNNIDEELRGDIKSIRCNMEKINNNLTKIAGMFGKVFHNMSKNHNNAE